MAKPWQAASDWHFEERDPPFDLRHLVERVEALERAIEELQQNSAKPQVDYRAFTGRESER